MSENEEKMKLKAKKIAREMDTSLKLERDTYNVRDDSGDDPQISRWLDDLRYQKGDDNGY